MLRAVAVASISQSTARDAVPRAFSSSRGLPGSTTSPLCTSRRLLWSIEFTSQSPPEPSSTSQQAKHEPGKRGRLQNAPDRLALGDPLWHRIPQGPKGELGLLLM